MDKLQFLLSGELLSEGLAKPVGSFRIAPSTSFLSRDLGQDQDESGLETAFRKSQFFRPKEIAR